MLVHLAHRELLGECLPDSFFEAVRLCSIRAAIDARPITNGLSQS